ncbi:MAG TPA: hypothetical protein VLB67_10700 [Acidimicrobiia bacterium]|nr:hypothetical protein [Acidimicrobiia bacterium]
MLLLISGASGVGKTTVRLMIEDELAPEVESLELWHLDTIPAVPDISWRQRITERAVERAARYAEGGPHVLLAGDPIAPGEVLAAPSAADLDVAVCLLHADPAAQNARLDLRNDPPEIRHLNLAYAEWLLAHATDPTHVPEALTTDAWEEMEWRRWTELSRSDPRWRMTVIDTSRQTPEESSAAAIDWVRAALAGDAPIFQAGWFRQPDPGEQ